MTRTDIINALIKKHGYKSYLEIGVQNGRNFQVVQCDHKVGVDPDLMSKATVYKTSDEFFFFNNEPGGKNEKFDIIFIDGLHEAKQVEADITNAMKALNEGGAIVCHDMNPTTEAMQRVPRVQTEWTGDCWKAWVNIRRMFHREFEMFVIDTDYGCGVLLSGKTKKLVIPEEINYSNFHTNKKKWLNMISVEDFNRKFNS